MKNLITLLGVLGLMFSLTSCGNNTKKIISGIEVETSDENNAKIVITDFKLDVGATELPFLHLPLPKDYGVLRTYRNNGENRVAIDLNLTEILKLTPGAATLPNGTMVPVDTNGAGIIEIPVSGINGKVYVAQKGEMTLVGFAFTIKQLDGLGQSIGTVGVFPNFEIGKVKLTAGIFTGDSAKQTGIAAFANLGGLWNELGQKRVYPIAYNSEAFYFENMERLPRWKKRRMYKELKRILNTKQTLELK
jgi:hypothetical protein